MQLTATSVWTGGICCLPFLYPEPPLGQDTFTGHVGQGQVLCPGPTLSLPSFLPPVSPISSVLSHLGFPGTAEASEHTHTKTYMLVLEKHKPEASTSWAFLCQVHSNFPCSPLSSTSPFLVRVPELPQETLSQGCHPAVHQTTCETS